MLLVLLEGCVPDVLIEQEPHLSNEPIQGKGFVLTWLPCSDHMTSTKHELRKEVRESRCSNVDPLDPQLPG